MHATFTRGRLEAFSDGVIAIIITIMVLEMKVPHGEHTLSALGPVLPVFLSYVLSFLYVGIYWNNHHHLLHAARRVDARVLWANLHLLFWLSLVPFVTGWMGENEFAPVPTALYGVVLLAAAGAYRLLQRSILRLVERDSPVSREIGRDLKGKLSPALSARRSSARGSRWGCTPWSRSCGSSRTGGSNGAWPTNKAGPGRVDPGPKRQWPGDVGP
jgi:uncharacterized membrane protein